ncbi:MAG: phasin family protein [Geminicoccaceae bacterium]
MAGQSAYDPNEFFKMMSSFKFPGFDMNEMAGAFKMPASMSELMGQFTKFQMPGVDVRDVMTMQQKNFDALAKANQLLAEGVQSVMQRQAEILQGAMTEASGAAQEMVKSGASGEPKENATKGYESAKAQFEKQLSNLEELTEIMSKAQREAMSLIQGRALAAFDEMIAMMNKKDGGKS